jgi:hypothetical protein
MLIYLDANIVEYCAVYEDFVLGRSTTLPVSEARLLKELEALRRLVELEQLGEGWEIAAPAHLMRELLSGGPEPQVREVYAILLRAWKDSAWRAIIDASEERILSVGCSLRTLNIKGVADRRHLAEAIALKASRFLTNDRRFIDGTRGRTEAIADVQGVRVARPSECIHEIPLGLFLK